MTSAGNRIEDGCGWIRMSARLRAVHRSVPAARDSDDGAAEPYGYRTAMYAGAGCTAAGICFMVCPEPEPLRCCASPAMSQPAQRE